MRSIIVSIGLIAAFASAGAQINLGGPLAAPGGFPILCSSTVPMTSDADLTLLASQYGCTELRITSTVSLTTTRNIIAPSVLGQQMTIINATTGGQSLIVKTSGGSGVTIPNAKALIAVNVDGSNYMSPGSITSIASTTTVLKGDGAGNATGATAGTDYVTPSGNVASVGNSASTLVGVRKAVAGGADVAAVAGTDYVVPSGTVANATAVGTPASTLAGVRLARSGQADSVVTNIPICWAATPTSSGFARISSSGCIDYPLGVVPFVAGAGFANQYNTSFTTTSPLTTSASVQIGVDTSINVTSTTGWAPVGCGVFHVTGTAFCWTGITSTSLTGVTWSAFGTPSTGGAFPAPITIDGYIFTISPSFNATPAIVASNTGGVAFNTVNVNPSFSLFSQIYTQGLTVSTSASIQKIAQLSNQTGLPGSFGTTPIVFSPARVTGITATPAVVNADCNFPTSACLAGQYVLEYSLDSTAAGSAGTATLAVTFPASGTTLSCASAAAVNLPLTSIGQVSGRCTMNTSGAASIQIALTITGNSGGAVATSYTMTRVK